MTIDEKNKFQETFSLKLKSLLQENSMNQRDLAKMLDISESSVGKWLLCKSTPRMGIIEKLASIFGVPKSYFFNENEDRHTYYMNPKLANLAHFLESNHGILVFLEKYIALDERGKALVNATLEHEYEFVKGTTQEKHA